MATLTGTTIQSTYDSLLKVTDNDAITSTLKRITDGLGNNTPLYLSSSAVEITSGLNVIGSLTASNVSGSNTGDETKASIETKLGAATSSNNGYLTSGDWSTFNNKIAGSGTLNKVSKFSSTGSIADSNITDNGTLVSISTATTITGNLTATNIIRSGGTSSQFLKADGSVDSTSYQPLLTNPVTGTGTTNTLPKFTGASAIGNSNITDTGSLITLGSNSYVNGNLGIGSTGLTQYNLRLERSITGNATSFSFYNAGIVQSDVTTTANYNATYTNTAAASFTLAGMNHYNAIQGIFGAGSTVTTQSGFRADSSLIGATNNYGFRGLIPSGTNRWNLYMDGTANNYLAGSLGIGTTNLAGINLHVNKNVTGATVAYGIFNGGTTQSDVTGSSNYYLSFAQTQATTFTLGILRHYQTDQGTFGAGSTVTTQVGYNANSTLIGATNNYGFRGQIPAGTNRFNLYMDGTADNHIAGSLGIGSTSLTGYNLRISKTITGAATSYGIFTDSIIQSDVTSNAIGLQIGLGTAASAFTLTNLYHANVQQGSFGAGSSVTNQFGFHVTGNLTGATNNYGFYGNIAAGTGRWNLYMNGTANNYLAGNLVIGTTAVSAQNLRVSKSITGNSVSMGIYQNGQIQSDVGFGYGFNNESVVSATSVATDYVHYRAVQGTWTAGGTVTNQIGFLANSTLTSATNNFGFRGIIASGTNRWNLYMDGTARNFLAGTTSIGSQTDNGTGALLQVAGGITYTNIFNRRALNYTLTLTDQNDIVEMNVGSANTVTVPTNASVAFPVGTEIAVMQYGSGQTTIVASAGVTIRSKSSYTKIADQYTGATLVKVGTDEWYLVGNLTA